MSVVDDIKAKMDANGDGKLNKDDLEDMNQKGLDQDIVTQLKVRADQNGDGKVDLADLKAVNLDISGLKDKLFGK
jgi:Ca2+-binding EF-hand superfamily protein